MLGEAGGLWRLNIKWIRSTRRACQIIHWGQHSKVDRAVFSANGAALGSMTKGKECGVIYTADDLPPEVWLAVSEWAKVPQPKFSPDNYYRTGKSHSIPTKSILHTKRIWI